MGYTALRVGYTLNEKKTTLTVPLPNRVMRRLEKQARRRMTSKAAIAREALSKFLGGSNGN